MDDLKLIKKHYGENMMHLCRELFPTLIEKGVLFDVLSRKFEYTRHLYDDIVKKDLVSSFKDYIYEQVDIKEKPKEDIEKTPQELLSEAGYDLYECNTEEEIQSFKKYYFSGEALCTFNGGRLNWCYVFFAVKKNVDEIKRENFINPERQDEYGTSVMSIQFSKMGKNIVSIKNRYNHTVNNPDSTFSNNLDNIIPGLTQAFNKKYNFNVGRKNKNFWIADCNYVIIGDEKHYKYNFEFNNIYFCPNNTIIRNFVEIKYEKEKYILFDNYLFDLVNKKIINIIDENDKRHLDEKTYNMLYKDYKDSFINSIGNIDSYEIKLDKKAKIKTITFNKNIIITLDEDNQIISYKNELLNEIGDKFLNLNRKCKEIEIPNVEIIGNDFMHFNEDLKVITISKVKEIGSGFLSKNKKLKIIDLAGVEKIGYDFLRENLDLKEIILPNVEKIGLCFLKENKKLNKINMPKVKEIDDAFMSYNNGLKEISLPNVTKIGSHFLSHNSILEYIYLPKVETISYQFLYNNQFLKKIELPSVKTIGADFMNYNITLNSIYLPNVEIIGSSFLPFNEYLKNIVLPKVEKIDDSFLSHNKQIEWVRMPKVKEIGRYFLARSKNIKELNLPNLEESRSSFLGYNSGDTFQKITEKKYYVDKVNIYAPNYSDIKKLKENKYIKLVKNRLIYF